MILLESLTQLNKGCVLVLESKLKKKGNFHCSRVNVRRRQQGNLLFAVLQKRRAFILYRNECSFSLVDFFVRANGTNADPHNRSQQAQLRGQ